MAEYIDREAFKKSVEERYCLPCKAEGKDYNGCRCRACWIDDMLDEVDCFQTAADVAPVVHARWKRYGKNLGECSECGEIVSVRSNYCPNCGAQMDEKENDNG